MPSPSVETLPSPPNLGLEKMTLGASRSHLITPLHSLHGQCPPTPHHTHSHTRTHTHTHTPSLSLSLSPDGANQILSPSNLESGCESLVCYNAQDGGLCTDLSCELAGTDEIEIKCYLQTEVLQRYHE